MLATAPSAAAPSRRTSRARVVRRRAIIGWLFVLPALLMYAVFVLLPLPLTIQYSFFRWNGVGPATWVGLKNYADRADGSRLLGTIFNAFRLVVFFSFIPVALGLVVASVIHRVATGRLGRLPGPFCSCRRSSRSLRPGSSGAGCCRSPGWSTRSSRPSDSARSRRAWLGDFDWALPAVGHHRYLGAAGLLHRPAVDRHDARSTRRSTSRRGSTAPAGSREFLAITMPLLRYEIGVCLTVTVIAALAAFDIVYVSTGGGPGQLDGGPRDPDLHPRVPRATGRPGVCSGGHADGPGPGRHPAHPAPDRGDDAMRVARGELYRGAALLLVV